MKAIKRENKGSNKSRERTKENKRMKEDQSMMDTKYKVSREVMNILIIFVHRK